MAKLPEHVSESVRRLNPALYGGPKQALPAPPRHFYDNTPSKTPPKSPKGLKRHGKYRQRLPHEDHRLPSSAESQQIVLDEPLDKAAREVENAGRIRVCVTSFRSRLCDPDNLCPKYFIDCLRYAKIIPDDREEDIDLTVRQVKVRRRFDEKTVIEITL